MNGLELSANSDLLRNCSKLELLCKITSNSNSNFNIWWNFRNQNISRTSDIIESYSFMGTTNQSKLSIDCAQLGLHDGLYVCSAQPLNQSEIILNKQIDVKIFGELLSKQYTNAFLKIKIVH